MGVGQPIPTRRFLLGGSVGIVGIYVLIAVLAYFASYTTDLPALEGAPTAVPLNNPTGWVGAKIAHRLIYRGFGWIGILIPLGLLYAGLQWSRGRPIRLKVLGWGVALLYIFSTFGGWLVQMGWVEDLLWCGSVGAGLTGWLSLYIGSVGLLLVWAVLTTAVVLQLVGVFQRWWKAIPEETEISTSSSLVIEERTETVEKEHGSESPTFTSWYEVIHMEPSWGGASSQEPVEDSPSTDVGKSVEEPKGGSPGDSSIPLVTTPLVESSPPPILPLPESVPLSFSREEPQTVWSVASPSLTESLLQNPGPLLSQVPSSYGLPPLVLLDAPPAQETPLPIAEIESHKEQIVRTLHTYGIQVSRISATVGPTVTLFELVPAPGVRISKIKSLEDDIALSLAALGIRIIAPIPGKGTIGIEVPHAHPRMVPFSELVGSKEFQQTKGVLPLALGKTITNETFVRDLAQMPHLLIAGATGQGKSVALNCMILSLLYRRTPEEVRLLLIDPKKVEMSLYQDLGRHYLVEVPGLPERIVTDVKQALPALQSLVLEMELRYELLKEVQARNITEYNQRWREGKLPEGHRRLPYIVLIIDELADLMMTAGKEVETPICRLAQLARAVGIHLIVATQRPSVNVITGLIKANFPVRISFRVVSRVDSRVILDVDGAERLIGRGDLLFAMGTELLRVQSGFVSSTEIERVVEYISSQPLPESYVLPEPPASEKDEEPGEELGERDPLFSEAAILVVRSRYGSTSLLQRKLGIGFNRAGRLMDQLEKAGIVGPARGSKPREVLVQTETELESLL